MIDCAPVLWYTGITTRAEYQGAFRSCAAFTNLLCGQSAPFYRTCVLAARVVTAASRKGRFAMSMQHLVIGVCMDCGEEIAVDVPEIEEDSQEEFDFLDQIFWAFYNQGGYMRECKYCNRLYPYFPRGLVYDCCINPDCIDAFNKEQQDNMLRKMEMERKNREKTVSRKKEKQVEEKIVQPEMPRYHGYIYLMLSETGLYKIGRTKDIKSRVASINRDIPVKVEVVHYFQTENCILTEKYLHQKFSQDRVKYEWFRLFEDQVSWITSCSDFSLDNTVNEIYGRKEG